MQQIILKLVDICSFRAGPQDLPTSAGLLRVLLMVYLGLEVLGGQAFGAIEGAIVEGLFELAVMALVLYLALQWQGKQARFVQAYTAVVGIGVVIGILSMPLVFAIANANAAGEPITNYAVVALLFLVWEMSVLAHIIRHTFEIHYGYALMATVLFVVVYVQVAGSLFLDKA